MKSLPKTLLRVWLVIWIITLPLVHIHPEADHAHAKSGHVHGGSYHSILVNTPVHAHQGHDQEEHHHDGFFSPGLATGPSQTSSHPPYDFEETTYGFSVIKPSKVLESENAEFSHDLVVASLVEPLNVPSDLAKAFTNPISHFSVIPQSVSSRAPPVLSV